MINLEADAAGLLPRETPLIGEETWSYEKLAYYKPPGWILFLDSLPTTGTQKVQKTQIFPVGDDPRQRPGAIDLRPRKKRRRTN